MIQIAVDEHEFLKSSEEFFRIVLSASVLMDHSVSSVFILFYGVLQGSVLGILLFILFTTSLSTVIFNLSANHHF
jgi:hypothetical protein